VILLRLVAALALVTWITCHAGLIVGLLLRRRWLHAGLSLLLPPFAVHWGWNMKRRARGWLVSLATYAVMLTILQLAE
jgi:hypothetical protein